MNKRRAHHLWPKLRLIKPWYFLILTLIFGVVAVRALYDNNNHMLQLRSAVFAADEKGVGIQESLQALQLYVTSHMNTSLEIGRNPVHPPIQLKYTYDRLVKAQGDQIAQTNSAQYNDAVAHCPSSGDSYQGHLTQQNCVIGYMQDKHNVTLPPIPDAIYKFDFASPPWSADLAGWSIVATILSFGLFVISLVGSIWFKRTVS